MNRKEEILHFLRKNEKANGTEISDYLGISKQAVNKHLKEMIQAGKILKEGVTRGTKYSIRSKGQKIPDPRGWTKTYDLSGLEEDRVFHDAELFLNLKKVLNRNSYEIFYYAFTEMVNNAIDHSQSLKCSIDVKVGNYDLNFNVRDYGIGIFYSIFNKYELDDEYSAIGELIKGKTTTMREKHSGEGIFFTSKAVDNIFFRSHKTKLIFDNVREDIWVEEANFLKGTEVSFTLSRRSKRKLAEIFSYFAPEEYDYEFNKTKVLVKLFRENYISRSEAKRLVSRLDRFKEIVLDFKGVKSIGQGFTDEIFRVFQKRHPEIIIKTVNLRPPLAVMIKHVVDNKK